MSKNKKKKKQKTPKDSKIVFYKMVTDMQTIALAEAQGIFDFEEWFTECGLKILVSTDSTPHGNLRHVSVSRKDRYPSWEEIKAVRDKFLPNDKAAMMVLPTSEYFVNAHENCFHVWESPIEWKIR